jgi:hypothetical protein
VSARHARTTAPTRAFTFVADAAMAAAVLGLPLAALRESALPVRFADKDRLQPIEYVRCTWSETVPWESEAGEQYGETTHGR